MTKATLSLTLILSGLSMVGCAHTSMRPPKDLGREKIVERIPNNRPDWIDTSFEEKKDSFYFKGQVNGVRDRGLGMRQAKASAVQNLAESVRMKVQSEFSEAIKGVNVSRGAIGRYLDSVVAWTTEALDVSGAVPVEEYSEKVSVRTYDGVDYLYNCYVWLRLPAEEYFRARQQAIEHASLEAQDEEARALAREAKSKLENQP